MIQHIIKRLLLLPVLLLIFSVFSFVIIQAPPGDFVTSYIAELASSGSSIAKPPVSKSTCSTFPANPYNIYFSSPQPADGVVVAIAFAVPIAVAIVLRLRQRLR